MHDWHMRPIRYACACPSSPQHTATHCNTHCHTLQDAATQYHTRHHESPPPTCQELATHLLQHAATRCNTLQHIATQCNTLQLIAANCSTLQQTEHTATPCNTLQHTAAHCNTLQHTARQTISITTNRRRQAARSSQHIYCNTLQHTATHRNTLQHTTTHCNTLQHTHATCKTRWQILGLQLAARITQTRANKDSIGRSRCRVRLRLASVERGALQTRSVRLSTEEALLMMQVYGTARAKDRGDLKYRLPTTCEEATPS